MIPDNQFFSGLYEIRRGSQANPAVASGFTVEAPENGRAELLALTFKLVADANAANRYIALRHNHGANPTYIAAAQQPQTTGTTLLWMFNHNHPYQAAITTGYACISLPHYPAIFEGDSIELIINNVQVGDQISEIAFTWKRWLIK